MGAFGSHEFIINEHAVGQAKAEELLTFELRWKSSVFQHHAVLREPSMMSGEIKLDPQCQPSHKYVWFFHLVRFSPGEE